MGGWIESRGGSDGLERWTGMLAAHLLTFRWKREWDKRRRESLRNVRFQSQCFHSSMANSITSIWSNAHCLNEDCVSDCVYQEATVVTCVYCFNVFECICFSLLSLRGCKNTHIDQIADWSHIGKPTEDLPRVFCSSKPIFHIFFPRRVSLLPPRLMQMQDVPFNLSPAFPLLF